MSLKEGAPVEAKPAPEKSIHERMDELLKGLSIADTKTIKEFMANATAQSRRQDQIIADLRAQLSVQVPPMEEIETWKQCSIQDLRQLWDEWSKTPSMAPYISALTAHLLSLSGQLSDQLSLLTQSQKSQSEMEKELTRMKMSCTEAYKEANDLRQLCKFISLERDTMNQVFRIFASQGKINPSSEQPVSFSENSYG